jgi:hypothetical protein
MTPCENSNQECRLAKSSDAANQSGHCFARNPVVYREYGSQGIATFAITSDADESKLGCKRANGQDEVGAESDCESKVRGDECGSDIQSQKHTQRPLFNTKWDLKINFVTEPANKGYGPKDFDDLKLFFYYHEYTDF